MTKDGPLSFWDRTWDEMTPADKRLARVLGVIAAVFGFALGLLLFLFLAVLL